jgi:hypothetical protein
VLGANRRDATWDEMHSPNNAGFIFENRRLTVDGIRIDNVGDGIRPRGGAEHFVIRNVWLSYVRDDCVENDHLNAGLVDDSLFDGCFVAFSARHSDTRIEGASNVWTIQNSLVRLEAMPGPPEGGDYGHKGFFKWIDWGDPDSRSPRLALFNNVFMAEMQGQIDGERMGIPPGKLAACANNVMVWLGPGEYPAPLPDCFTVTTDRGVWDDAVGVWVRRHTRGCETDAECDDGNPCTADTCDPASALCRNQATAEGAACGTGGLCCGGTCAAAACAVDADCGNGSECAADVCVSGGTCAAACARAPAPEGSPCSGGLCCGGLCAAPACAAAAGCDDGDACTVDACVAPGTCEAACVHTPLACGPRDGCCGSGCTGGSDPDCPRASCGNGLCEGAGEDCRTCPADCGCQGKGCGRACCGDGVCEGPEKGKTCPVDCR